MKPLVPQRGASGLDRSASGALYVQPVTVALDEVPVPLGNQAALALVGYD